MRLKRILKEYFLFTKKERIGAIAILVLTLIIWVAPKLASPVKGQHPAADTEWMTTISQLQNNSDSDFHSKNKALPRSFQENQPDNYNRMSTTERQLRLFYFDPNTLDAGGWERLGLSAKSIAIIQHYVNRGGKFRRPDDLRKIYGLSAIECNRLLPFVKIESQGKEQSVKIIAQNNQHSFPSLIVEINTDDTAMFISLPGIGSKLAARIINFRERLGGFYRVEQVGEVYGLPDSTFQKIKPYLTLKDNSVKQININSAGKDELKQHPYIRWQLANAIVEYRNQHGVYSAVTDLKRIPAITDSIYSRISPYLGL